MDYEEVLAAIVGEARVSEVIAKYPSARDLLTGNPDLLPLCKSKRIALTAAMDLARLAAAPRVIGARVMVSLDAFGMLRAMQDFTHEEFWVLLLSAKHELMREPHCVVKGGLTTCSVLPREVFAPAIVCGAVAVIVAHNHPSGDPTPSTDDLALTARLKQASTCLGIKLLDHLIIGNGRYLSMVDEGHFSAL